MQSIFVYNAAIYGRASKDDPDSNTIENQIEMIREFVKTKPDIRVVSVKPDNGYSGVDFLRPRFNKMMKEIEEGNTLPAFKAECYVLLCFYPQVCHMMLPFQSIEVIIEAGHPDPSLIMRQIFTSEQSEYTLPKMILARHPLNMLTCQQRFFIRGKGSYGEQNKRSISGIGQTRLRTRCVSLFCDKEQGVTCIQR